MPSASIATSIYGNLRRTGFALEHYALGFRTAPCLVKAYMANADCTTHIGQPGLAEIFQAWTILLSSLTRGSVIGPGWPNIEARGTSKADTECEEGGGVRCWAAKLALSQQWSGMLTCLQCGCKNGGPRVGAPLMKHLAVAVNSRLDLPGLDELCYLLFKVPTTTKNLSLPTLHLCFCKDKTI